ncbi:helicase-associated domain-containing protein [Nocardioides sp. Bht2]|uniref:helicase-associated domain-containing protein n=1 Tax=Nocardioides sp. Bht2 TaxID=3392297 RepID=UPI0039B4A324
MSASTPTHRSLADQLRSWPEPRLARLLHDRPDLATPAPSDSSALASRAATRASVLRALDLLTAAELSVLHALIGGAQTPGPETIVRLVDLALVWEASDGPRPLTVIADLLGPRPAPDPEQPALITSEQPAERVAQAAAGAAFDLVRRTETLLETWSTAPPSALRAGGLGVRDLRAAATLLHVEEQGAALIIEVAAEAGLLGTGTPGGIVESWLPTDAYDAWTRKSVAERWLTLVTAWLRSPRLPALIGSRDSAGKAANALAPNLVDPHAHDTRELALRLLAKLPDGVGLASGTGLPSLVAQASWVRPRRSVTQGRLIAWTISEAAELGVVALGALSPSGRLLVAGDADGARAAIDELLPAPLDHVLIQGDLTAIAPGPLIPDLAARLMQIAEVESRGGATVYRFTGPSIRRALDVGWTADELHAFLAASSRTPVPQALAYLVDDTARTHGTMRIGWAEAYLRCDDETTLSALLGHRDAVALGLRRIAPTVVISTTPIDELLPALRDLGAAPVVESSDGTVHLAAPTNHRARTPRRSSPGHQEAREAATISAAVAAIRAGDRVEAHRPERPSATTPAQALALLRQAVETGATVLIGYVDNHGTSSQRLVDPRRVEGGQLTAYDHRSEDLRGFAVHRITSVSPPTK